MNIFHKVQDIKACNYKKIHVYKNSYQSQTEGIGVNFFFFFGQTLEKTLWFFIAWLMVKSALHGCIKEITPKYGVQYFILLFIVLV